MRIAVLADIHGNFEALEAVIADLKHRAPDLVVNLGDSLSGPLEAALTADRLMELGWPTVRGNHDRYLAEDPVARMGLSDRSAFDQLQASHFAWLEGLPPFLAPAEELFLCHGTPESDETYLMESVTMQGTELATKRRMLAQLLGVRAKVVMCGHSHMPRLARLPTGQLVFNPGSVGLPAYEDEAPHRHVMQVGSPHARYGLADKLGTGWAFTHCSVEYDWNAAADKAAAAGRRDWENALRTGFAGG
jgi:predicted phosphodiesterase